MQISPSPPPPLPFPHPHLPLKFSHKPLPPKPTYPTGYTATSLDANRSQNALSLHYFSVMNPSFNNSLRRTPAKIWGYEMYVGNAFWAGLWRDANIEPWQGGKRKEKKPVIARKEGSISRQRLAVIFFSLLF